MPDIGPIQLLAVAFGPDADYDGRIIAELDRLEGKNMIRVLDLLFVGHDDETGQLVAFDYQGDYLGGLIGALLGFSFDDDIEQPVVIDAEENRTIGMSRAQLDDVLRSAPPDEAIGILLIEHLWARDFKNSIRDAGGIPIAEGFLSAEIMSAIAQDIEATVRVLNEIEYEHAVTHTA